MFASSDSVCKQARLAVLEPWVETADEFEVWEICRFEEGGVWYGPSPPEASELDVQTVGEVVDCVALRQEFPALGILSNGRALHLVSEYHEDASDEGGLCQEGPDRHGHHREFVYDQHALLASRVLVEMAEDGVPVCTLRLDVGGCQDLDLVLVAYVGE